MFCQTSCLNNKKSNQHRDEPSAVVIKVLDALSVSVSLSLGISCCLGWLKICCIAEDDL